MNLRFLSCCNTVLCLGVIAGSVILLPASTSCLAQEKQSLEGDRVALAYVSDGFLYAGILPKLNQKDYTADLIDMYDCTSFLINKAPLRGNQASANLPIGPSVSREQGVPQWRIQYGHYWSMTSLFGISAVHRIKVGEMDLYDPKNTTPEAIKRQQVQYEFSGIPPTNFNPIWFVHVEDVMAERKIVDGRPARYKVMYHEDVLPTGEDTVLAFINSDGTMRTWEGKYIKDKEGRWCTEWNPKVVETFETNLFEPFYVWAKGSDLFFVTCSGQLYYAKKPPAGNERKMKALWSDGQRRRGIHYDGLVDRVIDDGSDMYPIRGLIFDADSNRGFAFTRPKPGYKDQRRFYFEITAPLTPHDYPGPHGYPRFKLVKPPDNYTLRTLMEYAQFLIAQKEIKVKP